MELVRSVDFHLAILERVPGRGSTLFLLLGLQMPKVLSAPYLRYVFQQSRATRLRH
jgi:hypothetical protein